MFKIKIYFTPLSKFELFTRLIFYGLITLICVSFLCLIFFLYQRFYLTLAQAEEIIVLKSQLAVETLDAELYLKVKKAAEVRLARPAIPWSEFSNPFLPYNK